LAPEMSLGGGGHSFEHDNPPSFRLQRFDVRLSTLGQDLDVVVAGIHSALLSLFLGRRGGGIRRRAGCRGLLLVREREEW
jgi:hypothetical protein